MVIGNGMLAKTFSTFKDNPKVLIFASGVSNSKEISDENFKREEKLLENSISENKESIIVYFSTCSIYDNSVNKNSYVLHKLKMEELLKKHCKFYIFRLPQVVGKTKSPTLARVLFQSVLNGKKISVNKYSTRNLIDVVDVFNIVNYLVKNNFYLNEVTNIATPYNEFVIDIVSLIAEISGQKLNYELLEIGYSYHIDIDKIIKLNNFSDFFHKNYLHDLLSKYYREQCFKQNDI